MSLPNKFEDIEININDELMTIEFANLMKYLPLEKKFDLLDKIVSNIVDSGLDEYTLIPTMNEVLFTYQSEKIKL